MNPNLPFGADEKLVPPSGGAEALLWWSDVPHLPGEKLGVIGGFTATSKDAAVTLLERASARLRERGCSLAVGPMDGNTWRKYRLVTEPGTEPPFLLEPVNPPEWPDWWRAAGFDVLATYHSTATADLATRDPRLQGVARRMAAAGVQLRSLDAGRFDEELAGIHDVSVQAFQENFLYTPLEQAEFVAQYQAVRPRVRPELVLLAEQAGRVVGYVFVIPDWLQAQRGEPVSTVIVKTLAVRPGRNFAGLGALLLDAVHAAAERLGYRRAIHALMHENNRSRNLSAHYARSLRRYALYARRLQAS